MPQDIARLDVVFVKELADASGLSEKTVRDRMHRWNRDKADPLGIPFRPDLGKPWRMTRDQARAFLAGNREAIPA